MTDKNFGISENNMTLIKNAVEDAVSIIDGFELVEFEFKKQYGKLNLTAYIWKKDGVSLDDCEYVHNILSPILDEYDDMFASDYVMNVSSCGLDRKIVTNDDFRRAMDTELEAVDISGNIYRGILCDYCDESFTLRSGGKYGKDLILTRNNITKVQPYIRF